MKYVNFLLIISLLFCYTGLAYGAHHSPPVQVEGNHHNMHQEGHGHKAHSDHDKSISHKNITSTEHKSLECCDYAILNAPHDLDFNPDLYSLAVNIPNLEINKISSLAPSPRIKRAFQPPDLFLEHSSLLL